MILEGLQQGLDYQAEVEPSLEKAVWEASAAKRDGVARNPGGLARVVYRRRLDGIVAKTRMEKQERIQRMKRKVAEERRAIHLEALRTFPGNGGRVENDEAMQTHTEKSPLEDSAGPPRQNLVDWAALRRIVANA